MQDGQQKIKDLFDSSTIFNIPKYQRAYAWEKEQLDAFVEDLENQDTNKDHFFGTILLQEQEPEGEFKIIDIVDGQQRITTIIIFMKLLLTQHKSMGNDVKRLRRTYIKDDIYKLRVLDLDNDFFESYILEDNGSGDNEAETPSQRRLYEAKELLDSWIKAHPDKVEGFIKKIGNMKVLTYLVEDDSEAALIFETTNNRGKSLTSLEKVKSFLMHKTYLTSNSPIIAEDGLKRLQNRFSKIYRDYEEIEDSRKSRGELGKTDEDSILQYHSIKGVSQLYRLAREFKGDFDQLIKNLQNFVEDYCNDSEFERDLRQPRFYDVVDTGDQRYLFWKYENHLRLAKQPIFPEMSTETFTNEKSQTKLTIEHIIPQNPKESKKVVADNSILSIADFEENYLHGIGNLVLDSRSANASKSNQDFETKDEQYSKAPIKSQLELSKFCHPKPDRWNHTSISDRGDKIVKFALERWNPRKPGRISSEIEEDIRSRMRREEEAEQVWEEIWEETELPTEEVVE